MTQNNVDVFGHEGYISSYSKFYKIHVILKTITRTRTLKGGGRCGLTSRVVEMRATGSGNKGRRWVETLESGECVAKVNGTCWRIEEVESRRCWAHRNIEQEGECTMGASNPKCRG